jgi:GT2 family glycosyltransferase
VVYEKRKGTLFARERGRLEAKGEIIAFTDDDVIVDKYWLVNILKAFKDSGSACVGGKILPVWEKSPPKWLKKELYSYLALLDWGDEYMRMTKPRLWGANIAIKSSMFQKYGYFNTTLGRNPAKLYAGEEVEFIGTLIKNEEKVYYSPDMLVYHCIPEKRMKKSYFRRWLYDQGELKGFQMHERTLYMNVKVILYTIKNLFEKVSKFLWLQVIKPQNAFIEQLMIIYYFGYFVGLMKNRISDTAI